MGSGSSRPNSDDYYNRRRIPKTLDEYDDQYDGRGRETMTSSPMRPDTAEERLTTMRKNWAKETAKRIHVVVRVRPLNVREIKMNSKVI